MTLGEIIKVTLPTSRLMVKDEAHNLLYIGYVGMIGATPEPLAIKPEMEVTQIKYTHELWDKEWKNKGLREPLEKNSVPDQKYADLDERIYLYIRVKNF